MSADVALQHRLLRRPEVMARTGLSKSGLYAEMAAGRFPKSIQLTERTSAWIEREVDAWINKKITSARGEVFFKEAAHEAA